jgi:hypothetical protein
VLVVGLVDVAGADEAEGVEAVALAAAVDVPGMVAALT